MPREQFIGPTSQNLLLTLCTHVVEPVNSLDRQSDESGTVWMNRHAVDLLSAGRLDESGYFWTNRRGGGVPERRALVGRIDRLTSSAARGRPKAHQVRTRAQRAAEEGCARRCGTARLKRSGPRLQRQLMELPTRGGSRSFSLLLVRERSPPSRPTGADQVQRGEVRAKASFIARE